MKVSSLLKKIRDSSQERPSSRIGSIRNRACYIPTVQYDVVILTDGENPKVRFSSVGCLVKMITWYESVLRALFGHDYLVYFVFHVAIAVAITMGYECSQCSRRLVGGVHIKTGTGRILNMLQRGFAAAGRGLGQGVFKMSRVG